MNKIIIHDEFAALVAERDYLRARLAKARHHKKPYAEMTAAEYRAALNKLGLSIVSVGRTSRPVAPPVATLRQRNFTCRRSGREAASPRHPNRPQCQRSEGDLI